MAKNQSITKKQLLIIAAIAVVAITIPVVLYYLDYAMSEGEYLAKRGLHSQAIDQYTLATKNVFHKNDALAYLRRATSRRKIGEFDLALADLEKGLQLEKSAVKSPTAWLCSNDLRHRILIERGWVFYGKKEYEKALEQFDQSLELTKTTFAYVGRAAVFEATGNNKEAESSYEKGLACSANSCEKEQVLHERATYYQQQGQPDKALAALNDAINCDSNCADSYYERGLNYVKRNQFKLAIEDFQRSLSRRPDTEKVVHAKALAELDLRDYKSALLDINRAVTLNPNCAEAAIDQAKIEKLAASH
ncbi:MAG: tetratricopeptide repeat protein [Candidatus Melainabacteria bacterium]|nr:tetratricopeptide repeat protein [Candidatus Melainabacteria bacterium]